MEHKGGTINEEVWM